MNGVHDVGGMQDVGPVQPEKDEPVFHARWEGRIQAIWTALGALGRWNADQSRQAREFLPPEQQLSQSYYQLRFAQVVELLVGSGMLTRAEVESGRLAQGARTSQPPLTADKVAAYIANGHPKRRDVLVAPRFSSGQRVRARNIHPPTHTRLPRYARGKFGIVERDHGVFVFPDTNAQGLGESPQHLYSVCFAAQELWGEEAKAEDSVIIAMWDDYLEPA